MAVTPLQLLKKMAPVGPQEQFSKCRAVELDLGNGLNGKVAIFTTPGADYKNSELHVCHVIVTPPTELFKWHLSNDMHSDNCHVTFMGPSPGYGLVDQVQFPSINSFEKFSYRVKILKPHTVPDKDDYLQSVIANLGYVIRSNKVYMDDESPSGKIILKKPKLSLSEGALAWLKDQIVFAEASASGIISKLKEMGAVSANAQAEHITAIFAHRAP